MSCLGTAVLYRSQRILSGLQNSVQLEIEVVEKELSVQNSLIKEAGIYTFDSKISSLLY